MFTDTSEADQGWREDARDFVLFFGALIMWAAILSLGTDAYFLRDDLKKAECSAFYWKGRAGGQPSTYCPPGCRCRAVAVD